MPSSDAPRDAEPARAPEARPHRQVGALPPDSAGRFGLTAEQSASASRAGWDAYANHYQEDHGDWLSGHGQGALMWSPEGLNEAEVRLLEPLGELAGQRIADVGTGGGQAAWWLAAQGAGAIGIDISAEQLRHATENRPRPQEVAARADEVTEPAWLQGDGSHLPLQDAAVDAVVSAFGALAFVPSADQFFREIARVLTPAGWAVISTPHPMRWIFPDNPYEPGLTVAHRYFDRTPYVETDETGLPIYVEHHHTLADIVNAIAESGLDVDHVWEPEWPAGFERVWGGWGPITGAYYPRTLILRLRKRSS